MRESFERGLAALGGMQQDDGSFPLLQWSAATAPRACHPLFSTVCVLLAAGDLLPDEAKEKSLAYIQAQRGRQEAWNFDPGQNMPDDSDDTACALAVMARYGRGLTGAADTALLRRFWRADGGPFQTWHAEGGGWCERNRDDAVVNCNILLALREMGSPAGAEEIEAALALIERDRRGSRYYCAPVTITYAALRAGLPIDRLPAKLLQPPKENFLALAQWTAALKQRDDVLLTAIVDAQQADGGWPAQAWFKAVEAAKPLWGSAAISTAICIEALAAVSAS